MRGNNNTFVRKHWDPKPTLSGAYFLCCSRQKPEKKMPVLQQRPLLRLEVSVSMGSAHSRRIPQLGGGLLSAPASCSLMASRPFFFGGGGRGEILGLDPGKTIHEKLLTTCSLSFHVL